MGIVDTCDRMHGSAGDFTMREGTNGQEHLPRSIDKMVMTYIHVPQSCRIPYLELGPVCKHK